MPRVAAPLLLWILTMPAYAAEAGEPRWQLTLSSYLAEGDYGSDVDTRFGYAPVSLRFMARRGDLTVVVPYLDVTSSSPVVLFRGQPQPVTPTRGGTPERPATDGRRGTPTPIPTPLPTLSAPATRAKGIGDVALSGRFFLAEAAGARPTVDLLARVELPTGNAERGLGLGAPSAEIGVQLSKPMGRSLVWLADASYTFVGRPEDFEVRNTWEYAVGVGVYPVRALLVSVAFEEWRPLSPSVGNGRDLMGAATLKAGRALRFFASAQLPLSEAAPDFTAGAGIGVRF